MTPTTELLADLYKFIEVLDRRTRQLDQPSNGHVAFGAADLRERAISLIRQIEGNDRQQ